MVWYNFGSVNGFSPDRAKSLLNTMIYRQKWCVIDMGKIHKKC